jgi:hypothetical protein
MTLAHGFVPRTPFDLVIGLPNDETTASQTSNYRHWLEKINKIRGIAELNIRISKTCGKEAYDKRISDPQYKVGDIVFLKLNAYNATHESYKLPQRFVGPFQITTLFNERMACYLRDLQSGRILPKSVALFDLRKNKHYQIMDANVGGPPFKCIFDSGNEGQFIRLDDDLPIHRTGGGEKEMLRSIERLELKMASRLRESNLETLGTFSFPGPERVKRSMPIVDDTINDVGFSKDLEALFNDHPEPLSPLKIPHH